MEHLLRDVAASSSVPSSSVLTTQSLSTRVTSQLSSLRGLHARLRDIGEYLEHVRAGKLPLNHQILGQLQEIVGLLPQLGGDADLGKAFRVGTNDSTMVVYLSALIRTVLALHDLSECGEPISHPDPEISQRRRQRAMGWSTVTCFVPRLCLEPVLIPAVENRIEMAQQEIEDAKSPEEKAAEAAAAAAGIKASDVEKAKKEKEEEEKKAKEKK